MADHDGVVFPRLLTVPDVAAILCVPVSTLHHWAVRGDGPPSFKVGKHRRYDAAEVAAWLAEVKDAAA
ncbi:MAG: helix-turn-helix transcriptional regulator [Dermatophilaceae bacterium]